MSIIEQLSKLFDLTHLTWKTIFIERRVPWRVQRLITLIKINGLRSIITTIRFSLKKPKYRIVVSSIYFGGVGGTEKNLMSLVESMNDCIFYIQANNINHAGFVPSSNNYYLNTKISTSINFDLYYYYAGGGYAKYLGDNYHFNLKVINTNANDIRTLESKFDYVFIQSENYADFFDLHEKRVLAFPDVKLTLPKCEKKVNLPQEYFLTVFNPFSSKQKGYDLFLNAADYSPLPIIWCFNNKTNVRHDILPEHPNIIQMINLDQEELYYVYKKAKALVSFSTYESFGWVLAEAFFCNIPIISKKTGFLDYVYNQNGIYIYNDERELHKLLSNDKLITPNYSHELFTNNSYINVIDRLNNKREEK